ncbi:MAG TPA: hypothetical protein VF101_02950 [Gaiellaceae bacterium]
MKKISRPSFVLGFAAAIGALIAFGAVAVARPHPALRPARAAVTKTGAPSRDPLAVLSRPRSAKDELPPGLAQSVADLAGGPELAPAVRNGAVHGGLSHLALADLGSKNISLYIVPTAKGRVCLVMANGPQGCTTVDFTPEQPGTWGMFDGDGYRTGAPTSVYGLVPNNATRVTIVDDHGASTVARLANNAYFLELQDATALPKSILVDFSDGGSATMEVPKITVGVYTGASAESSQPSAPGTRRH